MYKLTLVCKALTRATVYVSMHIWMIQSHFHFRELDGYLNCLERLLFISIYHTIVYCCIQHLQVSAGGGHYSYCGTLRCYSPSNQKMGLN